MATEKDYQSLYDRIAALRETVTSRLSADLISNPQLADALTKQIDDMLQSAVAQDNQTPPPPDKGLGQLAGIGPDAASQLGQTRIPSGVEPYDETIASERIIAVGDMYYLWQHEKIGVFRAVQKLQELFRGGTVRLSSGPGAYALYQFDRREVLRYTQRDRLSAYKRIFDYGGGPVPSGSRANTDFHKLFAHFVHQVTLFWRDKRISDVIRDRAYDPSFGSIAIVRRAGLDLRNNLKWLSFGHLNVLRVEVLQLLEEAFKILNSPDIKRLFGADNAWDVVEEVLIRYYNERLVTSPRQRMGVTGREVLRWLAQPHILQNTRAQFETLLLEIAEQSEEWLTSAQAMGLAGRPASHRVLPWDQASPTPTRSNGKVKTMGKHPAERELEYEY
ncbi:hypothetical protein [Nevskia soli]|jgi:hypothetical protein|uniref:hypothetical protein n=1 Tax=Nevskia soli TaxID=418856 RepID=UPI0015D78AC2|nr:hypothetical protein [Nevskia soli]